MNAGMCDMNDWVEAGGGWRRLELELAIDCAPLPPELDLTVRYP